MNSLTLSMSVTAEDGTHLTTVDRMVMSELDRRRDGKMEWIYENRRKG